MAARLDDAFTDCCPNDADEQRKQKNPKGCQTGAQPFRQRHDAASDGVHGNCYAASSRTAGDFQLDALRAAFHEPKLRVIKVSFAADGLRDIRWRSALAAGVPLDGQSGDALDVTGLRADRDFGKAGNDFGRTDHHVNRVRSGLTFEKDGGAADVGLGGEMSNETKYRKSERQSTGPRPVAADVRRL